jgi:hypothetical protein
MKLSKFLSIIGLVTFFSLLYVYQQTEILRLAYVGEKKVTRFEDLLDKNSILRYNINKSGSLVQIGSRVSERADFQMPDSYQLVRLVPLKENLRVNMQAFNQENVLSRLFGIKRQAEAKTVNP